MMFRIDARDCISQTYDVDIIHHHRRPKIRWIIEMILLVAVRHRVCFLKIEGARDNVTISTFIYLSPNWIYTISMCTKKLKISRLPSRSSTYKPLARGFGYIFLALVCYLHVLWSMRALLISIYTQHTTSTGNFLSCKTSILDCQWDVIDVE